MSSMSDYDVIVVGAGPAGSTMARQAAKRGVNVLLIDKEKFPRVKPCAGGVIGKVKDMLDFDISSVIQRDVYGQRFYSPSGLLIDCTRPEVSGFMVMREEFDHLLFEKAKEAGAKALDGNRVVNATQDKEGVAVETENGERFTAEYLVGADGINGVVARSIGFYDGWKGSSAALCIEVEAEVGKDIVEKICGVEYDSEGVSIDIYFGPVPYGYAWCFPKRTHLSVGVGVPQDKVSNLKNTFNEWFEEFKKKHEIEPEILSDLSFRVPYSGAVKRTFMGRTVLLGDAAGFANPFSAEGISEAIGSGIIAAQVIERAVRTKDPKILKEYEKGWKAAFGEDLSVAKSLAKLMFKNEKNMETILSLAHRDPVISDYMYKLIAGKVSYKQFKSTVIKTIVRKYPRAGLSLYL